MLSYFRIQNYRSILDMTVDFRFAEGKAPNGYRELETFPFLEVKTHRVVPCLAFYGANASGKTNIIKAFESFQEIVVTGLDTNSYNPNKLNRQHNTTVFELSFISQGKNLLYYLEFNKAEIIEETLRLDDELIFSISKNLRNFENIVSDTYTTVKLKEIYTVECSDIHKKHTRSFLSVIGRGYSGLNEEISEAFNYITNRIEIHQSNQISFSMGLNRLAESYDSELIEKAFVTIVSFLKKLDIDINRMDLNRNIVKRGKDFQISNVYDAILNRTDNTLYADSIHSYHTDINGNEIEFDFHDESDGTQRLSSLLGVFLSVLKKGNIVIIDELECSLHSLLLIELIKLFKDKRYNKKNAQLVFTAHNTDIMDDELLRMSEIGIIHKTLKEGSTQHRISDFDGIRNVNNFRKQYLQGNFSGIPFPYI